MDPTLASLSEVPGVDLAAVVDRQGIVESVSKTGPAGDVMASLSSVIFGAIADSLHKGGMNGLDSCLLETATGAIQMQGAGDRILVAVSSRDANYGRVKLALKRAALRFAA
jgi:predicted regulator of Ras-like GTPase activity (Roadblock/LC7/MglB family)